jgi:hypothetical protein
MNPKFRRGFKTWADNKALEIRTQLGLKDCDPVCAFDLCRLLDIPVCTPFDIQGLPSEYLKALLNEGSEYWSAATIPVGKSFIIIHNPTHTPARQQSNLMHELAHILCEHKLSESKEIMGLPECLRDFNEDKENEADWLGGCLQLPRPALWYCLRRGMSMEDIAKQYNCSVEMAQYRINITGVKIQMARFKSRKYIRYN